MEPENFYLPVRHCLGAALLKQADDLVTSRPPTLTPPTVGGRALRDSTATTTATTASTASRGVTRGMIEDTTTPTTTTTATTTQLRDLYTQAISVYETDLQSHPATGWSLKGLMVALQGLGALGDTHLGQGLGRGIGLSPATTTATIAVDADKKEQGGREGEEGDLVRISNYLPLVQAAFEEVKNTHIIPSPSSLPITHPFTFPLAPLPLTFPIIPSSRPPPSYLPYHLCRHGRKQMTISNTFADRVVSYLCVNTD